MNWYEEQDEKLSPRGWIKMRSEGSHSRGEGEVREVKVASRLGVAGVVVFFQLEGIRGMPQAPKIDNFRGAGNC